MGFMCLSVYGSDQASDSASTCVEAFTRQLRLEFVKSANEHNTPGPLNVAMIIAEMCRAPQFELNDDLQALAGRCTEWLNDNPRYGDESTKSIRLNVQKFIDSGKL